ncbi:MAG: antibiotic biosynthesis monooxygenase [Candidatus Nanopelagicales bacterium]
MTQTSPWASVVDAGASLLVVARYRVAPADRAAFHADAADALDILSRQSGFTHGSIAQATDDADLLLIRTEWSGVGAYRRALSAYDVKVQAVPLLSRALDEPSAYEVVLHLTPDGATSRPSGLAQDAGAVALGSAAGPDVAPVTS